MKKEGRAVANPSLCLLEIRLTGQINIIAMYMNISTHDVRLMVVARLTWANAFLSILAGLPKPGMEQSMTFASSYRFADGIS